MSRKVRKQIYLDEEHDRALKRRAAELGVSESEVIRRALDHEANSATPAEVHDSTPSMDEETRHATWREEVGDMQERAKRFPATEAAMSDTDEAEQRRLQAHRELVAYLRRRAEQYRATNEPVRWSREEMYDERYADKFPG